MSRNPSRSTVRLTADRPLAAPRAGIRRIGARRAPGLAVAALLAASGVPGLAAEVEAPVLLVVWPQAELSRWQDSDGVPGRRFFDLCRRDGWILRPAELSGEEAKALHWAGQRAGDDLLWRAAGGDGGGFLVLGRGDGAVHLRWEGVPPAGDPSRLEDESRAWLPSTRRMRWEEVVEILDLTAGENRAFQEQREEGNAFGLVRAAYLRDKTAANVSIYLAGTRRPRALTWRLALTEAFESSLVPLVQQALSASRYGSAERAIPASLDSLRTDPDSFEEARRRLFGLRLLASRSRVYGRCDRILLSLSAEAPRGTLLLVDARASNDPFVAVVRVKEKLEAWPGHRGLLVRRLEGAWPR